MTWLINYARRWSVRVTSSTGGHHVADSYHYRARALDLVGSSRVMRDVMMDARKHPHDFAEAFHDPMGWYVKSGKLVAGAIGGHQDHVHLAR